MKKSVYCATGAALVVFATLLNRFAGGGIDLVLVMVLGLALLIASADVPTKQRVAK